MSDKRHDCEKSPGDCPDFGCDDPAGTWWQPDYLCEFGCGCRYGTADPDQRDCGCDGPCSMADPQIWGCLGRPDANCGGDCPQCPGSAVSP